MGQPPVVLTIAGSDSSGGAGIQADLKTFGALGAYGMSVVTAVTAQNTLGVQRVHPVPVEIVAAQLESVLSDVRVDAVKVGMLGSAEIADVIGPSLRTVVAQGVPLVVDPVMVSTSGSRLLVGDAVEALRDLMRIADVVTPNLAEAAALTGLPEAVDEAGMTDPARALLDVGCRSVLVKGGHLAGDPVDLLVTDERVLRFPGRRVTTSATHGTGCSLSSALAALRPQRPDWGTTVADAKEWLTGALQRADDLRVGHGNGPLHHFHQWW